ncbi:MAG TPA: DNA polymerase IV [Aestuariivirgaceae bacterium]|jgi:DNA polymerase-4
MQADRIAAGFCRDCFAIAGDHDRRCPLCHSPRLLRHAELHELSIAHIDCDAFYAAVEKHDFPELANRPVIVGGGKRGVVSTACYIARISGVKSAMPMFKALKLCPGAVVVSPRMDRYAEVGRAARKLMLDLTPLVEPLSIDEAFLDLAGTQRVHGASPALSLARLAKQIESNLGISVSIGLSYNKYLAKVASDIDKPRGFSIIGRADARSFLASRPVSLIWGVGKAMQGSLAKYGITQIGQLQTMDKKELTRRFGAMGERLYHLSRGEDSRKVSVGDPTKSIGSETTFVADICDTAALEPILWQMAEKVSRRAKRAGLMGSTIVLKLKSADFKLRTRSQTLTDPTQLAERIFETARSLLRHEVDGTAYRLIGVSISNLSSAKSHGDLADLDPSLGRRARAERAMDQLRERFGPLAVEKGLVFKKEVPDVNPPTSPTDWMDED